jgi:hypothetical protein
LITPLTTSTDAVAAGLNLLTEASGFFLSAMASTIASPASESPRALQPCWDAVATPLTGLQCPYLSTSLRA